MKKKTAGACSNLCGGFPGCAKINFSRAETAWWAVGCIVLHVLHVLHSAYVKVLE